MNNHVADAHSISHHILVFQNREKAIDEIPNHILGSKPDRQAGQSGRGGHGSHIKAKLRQRHEDGHDDNDGRPSAIEYFSEGAGLLLAHSGHAHGGFASGNGNQASRQDSQYANQKERDQQNGEYARPVPQRKFRPPEYVVCHRLMREYPPRRPRALK